MPTPKTKPAEPRSRDADRSQLAILLAARDEFAQHGLGGARVDRIAERADVNKRLIYYYFKSKDELFLAVLENAYADIREAKQNCTCATWTRPRPSAGSRNSPGNTIAHPEFLTLLNSENLHQGRHLAMSSRVQEMNSPLVQTLAEILERGRADGLFRGGIDPLQLYVSIAGMSYFYLSNNHTLSAIFGRDLLTPKARHERLSHCARSSKVCP